MSINQCDGQKGSSVDATDALEHEKTDDVQKPRNEAGSKL